MYVCGQKSTAGWLRVKLNPGLIQVCARAGAELAGFVNAAWDGVVHAFIVDTMVAARYQRQGIATQMLAICAREARNAKCEWLHVDFEERLRRLYFDRAGFVATDAGQIRL
ncbi:MAG: GNAT family N-acetyltransferase [Proteobacteria bacterium]|nr:GNAT family N-acetyltransferase [Pseudomonadota bacterium]